MVGLPDAGGRQRPGPLDAGSRRWRLALSLEQAGHRTVAEHLGDRSSDQRRDREHGEDRKSTRLNSSHVEISYAVFCLKKKKKKKNKTKIIKTKKNKKKKKKKHHEQ